MAEMHFGIACAKAITMPEIVTLDNMAFLTKCVNNGPDVYPGASIIITANNQIVYLNNTNEKINLNIGDCVERHIINKDVVLKNRNPRGNTYLNNSFTVVIDPKLNGIKEVQPVRMSTFNLFNADFDGEDSCLPKKGVYNCGNEEVL